MKFYFKNRKKWNKIKFKVLHSIKKKFFIFYSYLNLILNNYYFSDSIKIKVLKVKWNKSTKYLMIELFEKLIKFFPFKKKLFKKLFKINIYFFIINLVIFYFIYVLLFILLNITIINKKVYFLYIILFLNFLFIKLDMHILLRLKCKFLIILNFNRLRNIFFYL